MSYEADLLELGYTKDGDLTADPEEWVNHEPDVWNIWVTDRNCITSEVEEVLDLDIPYQYPALADQFMEVVHTMVDMCNEDGTEFGAY